MDDETTLTGGDLYWAISGREPDFVTALNPVITGPKLDPNKPWRIQFEARWQEDIQRQPETCPNHDRQTVDVCLMAPDEVVVLTAKGSTRTGFGLSQDIALGESVVPAGRLELGSEDVADATDDDDGSTVRALSWPQFRSIVKRLNS